MSTAVSSSTSDANLQSTDRLRRDPGSIEWTPELQTMLLHPPSWARLLELFSRTVKLAVALVGSDGQAIGLCHNPQPIWTLARAAKPHQPGNCLFCLEVSPVCRAAAEALRTDTVTVARDAAGFAHFAVPLSLGDRHLGWALAGQVLDRYPDALALQRTARDFGLAPQELWQLARQQAPLSRASLAIYGELLVTLTQTFLRDRYNAILQSSFAESIQATNRDLAALNSALRNTQDLAESARVYAESIVASVPEPLLVLDDGLHIRSANPAFYTKFQVTAEQTVDQLLYDLNGGAWNIPALRLLLTQLLLRDQWVQDFQMEHEFPQLGQKTMVLSARTIPNTELVVLAIHDITKQRESEKSLIQINLDLKHFAYAAAHDMQEPLRMIKLFTQLLAQRYRGQFDLSADQYLTITVENADRLELLLRDLREYWLVNEGAEQLLAVDCNEVLRKVIVALQFALEESGASITYDALPELLGQEVSLVMLLQNLVSNALKYRRPEVVPAVHVSALNIGSAWQFSVQDNGIGIHPEYLEKIFAPFKRLHGKEYPGTGIGLALCSKIVERYRGHIWAESVYGEGSTFYFTIPQARTD